MAYKDLRDFLAAAEQESQLLRLSEPVDAEPHLGAAARAVANLTDRGPALLFENINGYENGRVALNVVGSWPNHALMLGMPTPVKDQFFEFARRWDDYPVPVERTDDAPWREFTIDEGINLFHLLPLFRLNRYDVGASSTRPSSSAVTPTTRSTSASRMPASTGSR